MKRHHKSKMKVKSASASNIKSHVVNDKAKIEQLIMRLKKDLNGPMGMKFIKTVFYPELYKARIPYSLNNSSTSIVTHIEEIDINTGADGTGMLFFFPKVTTGPCIYQYLPDFTSGISGLYIYTWVTAASGTTNGKFTSTDNKNKDVPAFNIVSWRPITTLIDFTNAAFASSNDATLTALSITAAPTTSTKVTFSHSIDALSLHPMVIDFANASTLTPGTSAISSIGYPGNSAQLISFNNSLNASPLSSQTSLNHNFDAIYADLTTLFAAASGFKGASGMEINLAPTVFGTQSLISWPLNTNVPYTLTTQFPVQALGQNGAQLMSTAITGGGISNGTSGWTGLGYQNYATNYDKAALVGASMSLEYVGRFDFESGQISASHIEDIPIDQITTTDIQQGQFIVQAKPHEGIRMVWQPTTQNDFELFFTSQSDSCTLGARVASQSSYAYEKLLQKPTSDATLPQFYKVQTSAPCIALQWRGLTARQSGFRLSITRRFNMIPNKASKPIADLNRPDINIDPVLTMQKVFQLTRLAPFGGSTLADATLYNGVRQNFINAIELNPNLKFGSLSSLNHALTGQLNVDPAADDQG